MQISDSHIRHVSRHFQMPGKLVSLRRLGHGHINDTYLLTYERQKRFLHLVLQRINHNVFRNPEALMSNFERILAHLHVVWEKPDSANRPPQLIPARDGKPLFLDDIGHFWRSYLYISGTTYDQPKRRHIAHSAASIFGSFQSDLADFPSPRLYETIPDFHDTVKRFQFFEKILGKDLQKRAVSAKKEIAFALAHKDMASLLLSLHRKGKLPERIVHNDAKMNNVIFDKKTDRAISIIDLDTVMPGLSLYDFGDLVRTMTCPEAEDERDLSKITMRMSYFKAIADGYLSTASTFLNQCEKDHLAFGGKLITFETGLRFLTDHLNGDIYFKIHRPGQNLDRCRRQFKLVESIEQQEQAMNKYVEGITK